MDRIYLVYGSSGAYSDASEWPVRAFEGEADAQVFVAECEAAARRRPKRPAWRADRLDERYRAAIARWQERIAAFLAACPDDRMPQDDDVDYSVSSVPFGLGSTALNTAPPRLSQRHRRYDLTGDHEP